MTNRPAVFVRIEDQDGCFGWGEIFANWPAAGAEHRARLLIEDIADLVLDRVVQTPAELFAALDATTRIRAIQCGEPGPFAQVIAGLDIALHDLFARRADMPLQTYLNSQAAKSLPVYASGVHIADAQEVRAGLRTRGVSCLKVKVGFDLPLDLKQVQSLLDSSEEGERLFADANQGWTLDQALQFVHAMDDRLGWIEEPIRADAALEDWRRLAAESPVPLAAGENLCGIGAMRAALDGQFLTFVQPDVVKWGGLTGCLDVARMVQAAGATCCVHYLGGGIGLAASAAYLAVIGGEGLLEVDVNDNPLRDAFFDGSPIAKGGRMLLPDAPGLGIERIPEELAQFQTFAQEARV